MQYGSQILCMKGADDILATAATKFRTNHKKQVLYLTLAQYSLAVKQFL